MNDAGQITIKYTHKHSTKVTNANREKDPAHVCDFPESQT